MKRAVLVLRPEPGNAKTCLRATELGLNVISLPLFRVEPTEWTAPNADTLNGVLMTSANAARYGGEQLANYRHLPLFAVGDATAKAAQEAGFMPEAIGQSDAASVLSVIAAQQHRRILHLCGADVTPVAAGNVEIERRCVYRSKSVETKPEWPFLLRDWPIALIHSARAGARFAEVLANSTVPKSSITLVAISDAAARAAGSGWETIAIAANPRDEEMVAIAAQIAQSAELPTQDV
jgi:uroporphyrinogen-III synthase